MTTNTQLLLQGIINDRKAELAAEMEDDKFFQIFCLTEALKRYDLSLDEIQEGNVDGGNDGGIDALFIFVDGDPLTPYYQMRQRRDAVIELTIVQCKNTESFSGTAIDKLISTVNTLFDYSRPLSDLRATYNERLVERATLFRDFHLRNVAQFARLVVRFVYFSRAEREHGGLSQQVATLVAAAERLFPNATISFDFVGAVKLLEFARTDRVERLQLPITEGPIVVGEGGYLALVSLSDYYRFVVDSEGGRRRSLFLSNVRDYEGAVAVNRAIAATLRGDVPEDFWVLNNGVTLLAANVRVGYKSLVIEEPVIVNGLQTTLEIIRHFRQSADVNDPRMVLVRVMIPKTAESRDRVIVATNNQTAIAPGALRATDQVHRDIEQYFASKGLFYERRRNSQRNEGHPIEQIVTMPFLTKCMCAVSLQRPDLAVKINAMADC